MACSFLLNVFLSEKEKVASDRTDHIIPSVTMVTETTASSSMDLSGLKG